MLKIKKFKAPTLNIINITVSRCSKKFTKRKIITIKDNINKKKNKWTGVKIK